MLQASIIPQFLVIHFYNLDYPLNNSSKELCQIKLWKHNCCIGIWEMLRIYTSLLYTCNMSFERLILHFCTFHKLFTVGIFQAFVK